MKKIWNFDFWLCLAFVLAFMTFIGLLQLFRDPWCLRSPVICSNYISEHYFIQKQFSREISHFGSVCLWQPIIQSCHREAIGILSIWRKSTITLKPFRISLWNFFFWISLKKWRFEIFRTSAVSRGSRVIHDLECEKQNANFFQFQDMKIFICKYF